ncbi:uncharacterized protein MONOS_12480 [Monocercomonoides exilis]|uniref:uncharacterized protein n=1 Tax=Monocercomonoides exilis TaxID=2049356 RepID=UPI00355A54EC|nr:hypothetical protein MONOS_12480 [Monocercomonoides exilis]|eukprot:MONOS_12480.1-p1 / transcript=MONOS_12480.1 / gene=MONOS_12480 / organism=Monocercomonoides_exilis_PA203 / gene_product=unspecified product / transcript_product=unspecified product / location=Mono_scaffold00694:11724-12652(-) / protein_length=271 / sequence_SO=supercontig / SO=protein_coding / is_pseudo=false
MKMFPSCIYHAFLLWIISSQCQYDNFLVKSSSYDHAKRNMNKKMFGAQKELPDPLEDICMKKCKQEFKGCQGILPSVCQQNCSTTDISDESYSRCIKDCGETHTKQCISVLVNCSYDCVDNPSMSNALSGKYVSIDDIYKKLESRMKNKEPVTDRSKFDVEQLYNQKSPRATNIDISKVANGHNFARNEADSMMNDYSKRMNHSPSKSEINIENPRQKNIYDGRQELDGKFKDINSQTGRALGEPKRYIIPKENEEKQKRQHAVYSREIY